MWRDSSCLPECKLQGKALADQQICASSWPRMAVGSSGMLPRKELLEPGRSVGTEPGDRGLHFARDRGTSDWCCHRLPGQASMGSAQAFWRLAAGSGETCLYREVAQASTLSQSFLLYCCFCYANPLRDRAAGYPRLWPFPLVHHCAHQALPFSVLNGLTPLNGSLKIRMPGLLPLYEG
jgi:hypothetical protein